MRVLVHVPPFVTFPNHSASAKKGMIKAVCFVGGDSKMINVPFIRKFTITYSHTFFFNLIHGYRSFEDYLNISI